MNLWYHNRARLFVNKEKSGYNLNNGEALSGAQ
jgi:hypothetical protein